MIGAKGTTIIPARKCEEVCNGDGY